MEVFGSQRNLEHDHHTLVTHLASQLPVVTISNGMVFKFKFEAREQVLINNLLAGSGDWAVRDIFGRFFCF